MSFQNNMKRLFLACACMFMLQTSAFAQTAMTDQQVMNFVMSETEKGTKTSEIVKKLIEKNVPIEQIRRIRTKYEREKSNNQLGTRDLTGGTSERQRTRTNNGDPKDQSRNFRKPEQKRPSSAQSNLSKKELQRQQRDYADDYEMEMDFMLPDSLRMYTYEDLALDENKPRIFGHDIFNNKNLTFEPDMNIATPADYRLGPGDEVYIDVWGTSQKNITATISPEGDIDIEGFGPVQVSGLTVKQANNRLRSTLGQRYAGSNLRLSVGQTKTISVNVVGEVNMPGTYTVSAFATVFHALYMAGGPNDIGTLRNIKVYRNNREVATVDVYDYILNGHLSGNVRLASGDMIIVGPYDCLVNITGKVKRPMYYEMRNNESVSTLLKYAGGFTGDAYRQHVRLVRPFGGEFKIYSIGEFEQGSFQLCDGDSLSVDSALNRFTNMVEIKGAVRRPGMFQVDGNIGTVRQLIEAAGGLSEDAFTARAIIHRRKEDRTLEVLSVDVKEIMSHMSPDVTLRNEDVVFVPSKKEMQEELILSIEGEVPYPGKYEFAENTTLEDFILQAGGLKDAASVVKVDVARRIRNQASTQVPNEVAQTFSFELKEGFVLSGTPGFVLEPFDEVYVRRSPGYVEQQHVSVSGEVLFQGTYVLDKKSSRLSDLVKAAGGLTPEAYSEGAKLIRKQTDEDKEMQRQILKIVATSDSVDVNKIALGDTQVVGINLNKALANPGDPEWDIVLTEGDELVVPEINNTVSINGEVMYPNTVAYKKKAKLNFYINQAGGFSSRAQKRKAFAVNMNGTVTRVRSEKDIQPGCKIVVPAKRKRKGLSFAEIMSLSTMGVSLASVVTALLRK